MNAILMQVTVPAVLASVFCFILGICLAIIVYQVIARTRAKTFKQERQQQVEAAKKEAENIIKSAQIEAAAEAIKKKEQFTAESNKIRAELHETEMRLTKREDVARPAGRPAPAAGKHPKTAAGRCGKKVEQYRPQGKTAFRLDGAGEKPAAQNHRNEY